MGLNDEPTHLEGHVPAYDFTTLPALIAAGRIPQDKVEAAAEAIKKATAEKKSASDFIAIASGALGGLLKVVKPFVLVLALLCGVANGAQDEKDSLKADVDDNGVICIVLKVHVGELCEITPESERMKAVFAHAMKQAQVLAAQAIQRAIDEEKAAHAKAVAKAEKEAAEKAAKLKAKPEKKSDVERVWEMHELPGNWACAGKDCSRARRLKVVEVLHEPQATQEGTDPR